MLLFIYKSNIGKTAASTSSSHIEKDRKKKATPTSYSQMNELSSVNLNRFVLAAREYVAWCESSHIDEEPDEFRLATLSRLAELYAAAQLLPYADAEDGPDVPEAESPGLRDEITANLAPMQFQMYWETLDPTNLNEMENIGCGDIFDDLLDIHSNISDGLWLLDQGYPNDAIWYWHLLYFHWGEHTINAMRALHLYEPTTP